MSMQQGGLAKLTEETGELQQVVGKLLQYPYHQTPGYPGIHPDGTHLRTRLLDEMADVYAALDFVIEKLELDKQQIESRRNAKRILFRTWDAEKYT